MKQQQGSIGAEDVLKLAVSTCPIRCTKSIRLPDLRDAVERSKAVVRSGNEKFGDQCRKSLVEDSKGSQKSGGQKTMIKCAC